MGDVSALPLPITSYRLSGIEISQINTAKNALVQKCMTRMGFKDFRPTEVREPGSDDLKELDDLRYGSYDAAQVKKYGYRPDFLTSGRNKFAAPSVEPKRTPEEWLALTATSQEVSDKQRTAKAQSRLRSGAVVPEGGCLGESLTKLTGGDPLVADLVQQINGDSYRTSLKEPRVKEVFLKWSSCMRVKGYKYTDPMQANDDPKFLTGTASADEIATAEVDVSCKRETNLIPIWRSTEIAIQENMIAKNRDALNEIKRSKDNLMRSAASAISAK
ncbi:hypothetical protein J1792_19120 [Streptomyces triculaminicus]|uniref:Uncharacterized protein n=1 Tax=Streptomyces triculaminicus TaxID=2816232 RepID=A0A939JSL5_9ACTN|nr:hypothetical protein [Streptomyces triculaminicus]MBO0654809.1 hypothetical protein [Streptomyces triculaminicus]